MSEWDAKDNIVQQKEKHKYKICEDCGVEVHCVSSDEMEFQGREGSLVCNHCYDLVSGNNECNPSPSCGNCIHHR